MKAETERLGKGSFAFAFYMDRQKEGHECGVTLAGNFTTAIAKGNHKAGEIQGQTRQHSRLINLLGVKQICIGVNKILGRGLALAAWGAVSLGKGPSPRGAVTI